MSKKGRRPRENAFEKWLSQKEAEDRKRILYERMIKEKQKQEDDDKKRQAEFQDKSYEQWLVDKEVSKVSKPRAPTIGVSPSPATVVAPPKNPNSLAGQTTEEIIRRIIDRREREAIKRGEEAARVQEGFRFWLDSDNEQLFDHITHHGHKTVLHFS